MGGDYTVKSPNNNLTYPIINIYFDICSVKSITYIYIWLYF